MRRLLLLILLSCALQGCLPAVFTAASSSSYELAKDRSAAEALKDAKIASAIRAAFIKNNFRELYTKIHTDVVNGRILYTGMVGEEEDMMKAIQIAWDQEGVKEVINELKIDENSNYFDLPQFTRDTMITSQIKSKIFINRDIKFVNYTVITINDIVYLFGIARSEEELKTVAETASLVRGVKKVVVHVKVDENFDSESNKDKDVEDIDVKNNDTKGNDAEDLEEPMED